MLGIKSALRKLKDFGRDGYSYSITYDACMCSRMYYVSIRHITDPKDLRTYQGKTMTKAINKAIKGFYDDKKEL